MNHNFLGAPTREDLQTLDHLRRQLMPMIALIDKLHHDITIKLHQGAYIDWAHVRHATSTITFYISSINAWINGSYQHKSEEARNADGKPILDGLKNAVMVYRDVVLEGQADRMAALHPFPQAPFPMRDERLAGMALHLLDKRLGPAEEKWVEERVRKAAEFAYVPGEWGVEPRKPTIEMKGEEESDDVKGWDDGLPTKRVKGALNEDQLMELWGKGHRAAFDKQYANEMRFGQDDYDEEQEGGADETGEEEEEDEDMGEDEQVEEVDTPKAPPAPPVQMIQRAPQKVHLPIVGARKLLSTKVGKFMASGRL
jgi:hypothetical protein